uniref:Uncharacterized protein n=1 Tax=Rhizophora mucronata TaxID=61149 RepID=A0A2P2P3V7_RHIMU
MFIFFKVGQGTILAD